MGVGLFAFSFDWTLLSYFFPVAAPIWSTVNYVLGVIFWQWFLTPLAYYANFWGTPTLDSEYTWKDNTPAGILNSLDIFNRNGTVIYIKRPDSTAPSKLDPLYILNQKYTLDESKFKNNFPFFLTEMSVFSYFCGLAQVASIFSHVFLWYGKEIHTHIQSALKQINPKARNDIHNQLSK